MTRKMYSFAQEKCAEEGMDPVMMQEISLAGHLYLQLVKDRLTTFLTMLKFIILKKERLSRNFKLSQGTFRLSLLKDFYNAIIFRV